MIESLGDIPDILNNLSEDDYHQLLTRVACVSENVKKGHYMKCALEMMFQS